MLDALIKQLAADFELGEIAPAMPGVFVLPVAEDLSISLSSVDGGISFTATLGDLPQERREEFLVRTMHANFLGQGTEGAVLSLSDAANRLTLTRIIDYTTDYKQFKEALEDFINAADMWKDEAKQFGKGYGS